MVCLGNICRSPLAEGILTAKIAELGLDHLVDSAGTSGWHVGSRPHEGSIKIASEHGIDISHQKSRQFTTSDYEDFDLILAMDSENYKDIMKLAANEAQKKKVKLMLNYAHPGKNMAVPDPYYTGNFKEVYNLLEIACANLVTEVRMD